MRRIDNFLNDLMSREFAGGVKVKDAEKAWSSDSMSFSFKVKKGLIGTTISGVIQVNDQSVVVQSELPRIVTTFVAEDKIRDVINKQFDACFPRKSESKSLTPNFAALAHLVVSFRHFGVRSRLFQLGTVGEIYTSTT